MKWRNSKERELLSSGGSRDVTLPSKDNPHPDLSDVSNECRLAPDAGFVVQNEARDEIDTSRDRYALQTDFYETSLPDESMEPAEQNFYSDSTSNDDVDQDDLIQVS